VHEHKLTVARITEPAVMRGGYMAPSTDRNGAAQTTPLTTTSNSTPRTCGVVGTTKSDTVEESKEQQKLPPWRRVWEVLTWTPPNCRWDPNMPPQFSMSSMFFFLSSLLQTILVFFLPPYTLLKKRNHSGRESRVMLQKTTITTTRLLYLLSRLPQNTTLFYDYSVHSI
jgi:hypothetical protein